MKKIIVFMVVGLLILGGISAFAASEEPVARELSGPFGKWIPDGRFNFEPKGQGFRSCFGELTPEEIIEKKIELIEAKVAEGLLEPEKAASLIEILKERAALCDGTGFNRSNREMLRVGFGRMANGGKRQMMSKMLQIRGKE